MSPREERRAAARSGIIEKAKTVTLPVTGKKIRLGDLPVGATFSLYGREATTGVVLSQGVGSTTVRQTGGNALFGDDRKQGAIAPGTDVVRES